MSFGMIFSIILIVVFIASAFYGISKFLDYQKKIQIGQFAIHFQENIDKIWKSSHASTPKEYFLPTGISHVCFNDFSKSGSGPNSEFYDEFQLVSAGEQNMFFYPIEAAQGLDSIRLKHINVINMTSQENPYCVENTKGKIEFNIKINLGENLVTISR